MKKFRFAIIFTLSIIFLAPLAASATQCCYSPGVSVPSPYGGSTTPPLCDIKTNVCASDRTEIDCGAQPACAQLLPKCCVYKFSDPVTKNLCQESPDRNYDCTTIQPTGTTYDVVISRCADLADCTGASGNMFMVTPTTTPAAAAPEYPIIQPTLSINIPTISMPDFTKVIQKDGYVYIPFISVYLVGAYKLGVGIAAILAIIMIMAGGFIWIASAGDAGRVGQAKKMISGAVVGLVLTVGSYVALQIVNPNLVNFTALKIRVVSMQTVEDVTQDQESDITDDSSLPANVVKPTWDQQSFICPPNSTVQPPTGVANPSSLVSLDNCPSGVSSSGKSGTQALHDALCNAGAAANADGYMISITSAYRDFASQAALWCGTCATNHPDVNQRKTYCAIPGFSNHGLGNAVDVVLLDSSGKALYQAGDSSGQCKVDPATVTLIEKYMEGAGFVRYQNEIWHFEFNTNNSNRCSNCGLPHKC